MLTDDEHQDILIKDGKTYVYDDLTGLWRVRHEPGLPKAAIRDALDATKTPVGTESSPGTGPTRAEKRAWVKWNRDNGLDPITRKPTASTRAEAKRQARESFRARKQAEREFRQRQRRPESHDPDFREL